MRIGSLLLTNSLVALCLIAVGIARGQDGEGPGQRVGQAIDKTIEGIGEGAKDVAEDVRADFKAVHERIDDLNVESRVYARLHWDKALHDIHISIRVREDGVTTLRGVVPNEVAKLKAEQITSNTVGVEQVVSELIIIAPAPAQ